jgi:hypothetical protein
MPLYSASAFVPNDLWLKKAEPEHQVIAMREWFLSRYCDPAIETPYICKAGDQYIHGGPYSPSEELYGRFVGIVSDAVIAEVVHELEMDVGQRSPAPAKSDTSLMTMTLGLN